MFPLKLFPNVCFPSLRPAALFCLCVATWCADCFVVLQSVVQDVPRLGADAFLSLRGSLCRLFEQQHQGTPPQPDAQPAHLNTP